MNIVTALLNHLKKKQTPSQEDTPEGFCPNCWGRNEYGGQFYEAVKNNKMDVNSKNPDIGWVQDYADKHLKGVVLQPQDDSLVCSICKVTYRPEK